MYYVIVNLHVFSFTLKKKQKKHRKLQNEDLIMTDVEMLIELLILF